MLISEYEYVPSLCFELWRCSDGYYHTMWRQHCTAMLHDILEHVTYLSALKLDSFFFFQCNPSTLGFPQFDPLHSQPCFSLSNVISCHSLSAVSHFGSQRQTPLVLQLFFCLVLFHGPTHSAGGTLCPALNEVPSIDPLWSLNVPLSNPIPCHLVSYHAAILH